jgi:GT2 family glycosyltransferase
MSRQKNALIITIKNDADTLVSLRQDIEAQTIVPDEVILTVADSSDGTLPEAQAWARTVAYVQVIVLGLGNRSQGRNVGVQASSADIFVFTDAGCRFGSDWFQLMIAPFEDKNVELVSGLAIGAPENDWEAAQVPYALVLPQDVIEHPLPATRAMAVRRFTFEKVGPFREDLPGAAEDFEWSRRAVALGIQPHLVRAAVVRWRPRQTRKQFWKMLYNLTLGDTQAGTWRRGHGTMLARYAVLLGLAALSAPFSLGVWVGYIAMKSKLTSVKASTSWWHTAQAQTLADAAVVSGLLHGFWLTATTMKQKQTL